MIITANYWFGMASNPIPTWEAWKARFLLRHMVRHGVQAQGISGGPALPAIIRQGKWLILCPSLNCNGAEKVWEEGLMMCCSCLDGHAGHRFLRTFFPVDRAEIEEVLEPRPMENRNWEPPETLADLQVENIEHGVEVP